jgi:hypothetical protein
VRNWQRPRARSWKRGPRSETGRGRWAIDVEGAEHVDEEERELLEVL